MAHADAEHIQPHDRAAWRHWLEQHHRTASGVWVIRFKKAAGTPSPTYEELVLEALCFGWIDSRPGKVDDERTRLYFSPRRRGSGWAATNKARVDDLITSGLMAPAGQAVIDEAKADGSWTRLDTSEAAVVPAELASAFLDHPGSQQEFDAFPAGVRKQLIFWVDDARRPETKARRADEIARLAAQGIRANQWSPKTP